MTFSIFAMVYVKDSEKKVFFFDFYSFIFMGGGQNRHFTQFGPIANPSWLTPPHPPVRLQQLPKLCPTNP